MRLWILSDLHLNFSRGWVPTEIPSADVAVVAGDVGEGAVESLTWLGRTIAPNMHVVFVCGNHEFYRRRLPQEVALARNFAQPNVHFLENDSVDILGATFSGCTLWTDYELDGQALRDRSMAVAAAGMNDHRLIGWEEPLASRRFRPENAATLHSASREFLDASPSEAASLDVVVTHHAPSRRSISPKYRGDPLNVAFASDLEPLIVRREPRLWVHGHVHSRNDYRVGATRVVSNPMGYPGENKEFDPALVIEIDH